MKDIALIGDGKVCTTSRDFAKKMGLAHATTAILLRKHKDGLEALSPLHEATFKTTGRTEVEYLLTPSHVAYLLSAAKNPGTHAILGKLVNDLPKKVQQIILQAVKDMDLADVPPDRFVYAAQDSEGRIKIGISKDPERRVAELNIGNPDTLTLVYQRPTTLPRYGDEVEAHKACSQYRIRSEWFRPAALEILQ